MSPLAVLNGAGWRLVFEQHADRIRHRIEVATGSEWRTLIESVEGEASRWWPPSPPLQSLHVETRPAGNVALLVGMSGRSHWSASVEIADHGAEAVFDMACRAPEAPEWLGSHYAIHSQDAHFQDVGPQRVEFRALEPQAPRITRTPQGEVEILALPTTDSWPQTVRWRYAARVV